MEDRPLGIKILTVLYALGTGIALITLVASIPGLISGSEEIAKLGVSRIFVAFTLFSMLGLLLWATAGLMVGERWGWIGLASQVIHALLTNATYIYNMLQVHISGTEMRNIKTVARSGFEVLILIYILTAGVLNFFSLDADERWSAFGKAAGIAIGIYTLQQLIFWIA